jgi:hypothetical protein
VDEIVNHRGEFDQHPKQIFFLNPAKGPPTPVGQASTERQSNEPDPGNAQVSTGCFKLTGQEIRKVKLP